MIPSNPVLLLGPRKAVVAAAALAADGGGSVAGTNTSLSVSVTTANAPGLIVVGVLTASAPAIGTVTAPGLTFTANSLNPQASKTNDRVYFYTAPYSSNFSGNITVTVASAYFIVSALAISGAKTSSFEDSGGPVGNSTGAPAITTTNANDAVVAFLETNGVAATAGSGWTASPGSDSATFAYMIYRIVSATGTYTAAISGASITGGIITGIKQGP